MDNDKFEGLLKGIREAGKVKRGEVMPSQVFVFTHEDIKDSKVREAVSEKIF